MGGEVDDKIISPFRLPCTIFTPSWRRYIFLWAASVLQSLVLGRQALGHYTDMAPDAGKSRRKGRFTVTPVTTTVSTTAFPTTAVTTTTTTVLGNLTDHHHSACIHHDGPDDPALECVLESVMTDFSHVERPARCKLILEDQNLSFNGRTAVFLACKAKNTSILDEFVLLPCRHGDNDQVDAFLIQNTKTQQYLCASADSNTAVYASKTRHSDGWDRWVMQQSPRGGVQIVSAVNTSRQLTGTGSTVHTSTATTHTEPTCWKMQVTSGELCFLSLPLVDMRLRCDMVGNLSLSKNYQGWEVWRFSEVGDGDVRISPWAHADMFLSSAKDGKVSTTDDCGPDEVWCVQKAPNGLYGMILVSKATGRVLRYNRDTEFFDTIADTAGQLDEACVWDVTSIHQQIYYLTTNDDGRKLEASRRGITTRKLPGRLMSEEWKIETIHQEYGAVTLFSNARQQYLGSNQDGEVFLMDKDVATDNDDNKNIDSSAGLHKWRIEVREEGLVVISNVTQRVLVAPSKDGSIRTVPSGTIVHGSTRWTLEPRMPRQVNKEKMQAVGAAVALGVATTVATPFVIGGAIGIIGIAQVGVAGQVAIGSIRAAEALTTITRVTTTSSELITSRSGSSLSLTESMRSSSSTTTRGSEKSSTQQRNGPFSSWRSW